MVAKQKQSNDIKETIADKSFDGLDKLKEKYEKLIKNVNRNRKKGFKDFESAWRGVCPGCPECVGDGYSKPGHQIDSMDTTAEGVAIGLFSEKLVELNAKIELLVADCLRQQDEKKGEEGWHRE